MASAVERYLSSLPYIAAQRGAAWGFAVERVVAAQPEVTTDFGDVWEGTGDVVYPPGAAQQQLVSTSAADAAAGAGARQVRVEGLGASFEPITETVTLNGLAPVTTAGYFLRVNRLVVAAAGASGFAQGTITSAALPDGDAQAVIVPGPYNVSRGSHYTVPAGSTAYLVGARYGSDVQTTRFVMLARPLGAPWRAVEATQIGLEGAAAPHWIPIPLAERTDVRVVARRPTSQTALAEISYEMIVLPATLAAIRSFGRPQV